MAGAELSYGAQVARAEQPSPPAGTRWSSSGRHAGTSRAPAGSVQGAEARTCCLALAGVDGGQQHRHLAAGWLLAGAHRAGGSLKQLLLLPLLLLLLPLLLGQGPCGGGCHGCGVGICGVGEAEDRRACRRRRGKWRAGRPLAAAVGALGGRAIALAVLGGCGGDLQAVICGRQQRRSGEYPVCREWQEGLQQGSAEAGGACSETVAAARRPTHLQLCEGLGG